MGKNRQRSRSGSSRSGYSRRRGSGLPCCYPLGPFSLPATGIVITALVIIAYRLITETMRLQMLANLQLYGNISNSTTPVDVPLYQQGLKVRPATVLELRPILAQPTTHAAIISLSAQVPDTVSGSSPAGGAISVPSAKSGLPVALATKLPQPTLSMNHATESNPSHDEQLREVPATDATPTYPPGVVPLEIVSNYRASLNDSQVAEHPVSDVARKYDGRNYEVAAKEEFEATQNSDQKANVPSIPKTGYETSMSQEESKYAAPDSGTHAQDLGEYDTSSTTRAGLPSANANHSSIEVRKGNNVLRIPQGSRITGALPEFSGVITRNGSMVRGHNVTRVSYALYKIVKLFGFTSMVDSPAGSHIEWMSPTLQRIEFDRPSFKYWGIDSNLSELHAAREAIGAAARSEYRHTDVTDNPPAGVDVLFHWTDLDGSDSDPRSRAYPHHIDRVIRSAQRANATYIIFGQFPRRRGLRPAYRYGKWVFLEGARTKPFLYNDYVRGVVPVMPNAKPYVLYMTFYSVKSLPS